MVGFFAHADFWKEVFKWLSNVLNAPKYRVNKHERWSLHFCFVFQIVFQLMTMFL